MCAKFLQKFTDAKAYNAAEHQYPNISLVEGEGLIWTAEEPEPDVLLNGSKIKWNVTDGGNKTSIDYPSISFSDAQTLINALNDTKSYTVTATASFNDGGKNNFTDVECWLEAVSNNELTAYFNIDKDEVTICNISLFSNAKSPAFNAVEIVVSKSSYPTATWEINYTIEEASQDDR